MLREVWFHLSVFQFFLRISNHGFCGLIIPLISIMKEDLIKREWWTRGKKIGAFLFQKIENSVNFCRLSHFRCDLFQICNKKLNCVLFVFDECQCCSPANIFLSGFALQRLLMTAIQHYCPLQDIIELYMFPVVHQITLQYI